MQLSLYNLSQVSRIASQKFDVNCDFKKQIKEKKISFTQVSLNYANQVLNLIKSHKKQKYQNRILKNNFKKHNK